MSQFQKLKLMALAVYVIVCGILVSATSYFIVNGLLS